MLSDTDWGASWTGVFLSLFWLLFPLFLSCLSVSSLSLFLQRIQVSKIIGWFGKKKTYVLILGCLVYCFFCGWIDFLFLKFHNAPFYFIFHFYSYSLCAFIQSFRDDFMVNLEPAMDSKLWTFYSLFKLNTLCLSSCSSFMFDSQFKFACCTLSSVGPLLV